MAEEKILTKHPLGKSGKNISKQKYETLKKAILSALKNTQLTQTELFSELNKSLRSRFSGNISWYGETVKLDLEARKMIERTSSKPQKYRLKPGQVVEGIFRLTQSLTPEDFKPQPKGEKLP
jgi:hypothetical protein